MPTACYLPASEPRQNGDLISDTERAENAWARCAQKVDATIECMSNAHRIAQRKQQGQADEKATKPP